VADLAPKIVALWLVPPGLLVAIAVLGFLIGIRWRYFGSFLVLSSIAATLIFSLPLTGEQLMRGIESRFVPLDPRHLPPAPPAPGAIVVLGGGRYADAPEFGGDTVNGVTLERLRYAASLHRLTGLPILVSGGKPAAEEQAEAELMQAVLAREFQVPAKWVEARSATTFENAKFAKAILVAAGIRRVYLVTHAWHMPRALWAFETVGMDVVPAPMGFTTLGRLEREVLGYFPSACGLELSSIALHERLGLLWYELRYRQASARPADAPARTP
jgi:uncharacterized SAM-binding protein YcdF (DUF218 family)